MTELPLIAQIHFWVGTAAVATGCAALLLQKGSRWHRVNGFAFFLAIIFLSLSGLYLSAMRSVVFTAFLSVLTLYLVTTGWVSAKRQDDEIGWFETLACLSIFLFGIVALIAGYKGATGSIAITKDVPFGTYYVMAGLAALFTGLDLNQILRSGLFGKHRIARHLWRMCSSMLIAVTIFFLGNNHVLPEALRVPAFLLTPIFVVILLMVFWLVRVLTKRNPSRRRV